MLVRPAETEETIPGGLIVLTQNAREKLAAHQMEIVCVGAPEACDDPENCNAYGHAYHMQGGKVLWHEHLQDIRLQPGAWIYCRPRSLIDACHPTEKLYFIKQSDVLAVFSTEEGPAD